MIGHLMYIVLLKKSAGFKTILMAFLLFINSCVDSKQNGNNIKLNINLGAYKSVVEFKSCYITHTDLSHVCLSFDLKNSAESDVNIESECNELLNSDSTVAEVRYIAGKCDMDDQIVNGYCVANISNEGDQLYKYYYAPVWNEDLAKEDCQLRSEFGFTWESKVNHNIVAKNVPDAIIMHGSSLKEFFSYSIRK